MSSIKNILICGLGAIGGYYASVISNYKDLDLRILVDKERFERYKKSPRIINGKEISFAYLTPECVDFKADLIIIATKSSGLNSAIHQIKNFVGDNTIILSFLNGITSEEKIADVYGHEKILYSYLLGHTFFRERNSINHDGNAKIVFGSPNLENKRIFLLKDLFDKVGAKYEISKDIIKSLWLKFAFNCCANQLSAVTRKTFDELRNNEKCLDVMRHICDEVSQIAKAEGIDSSDFWESTLNSLDLMIPDGKTSMLQDIEAGIRPETDIFGRTVYTLGKKYGIETPYNKILSDVIESLHG